MRNWFKALGFACGLTLSMAVVMTGLLNYPLVVAPMLFIALLTVLIKHDMR